MTDDTPLIEDWEFIEFAVDHPQRVASGVLGVIEGKVYNDKRPGFYDGAPITTSGVLEIQQDPNNGPLWVQTRNTRYRLGKRYER